MQINWLYLVIGGINLILYYPKLEFNFLTLIPLLFFCVCLYNFITQDKGIILFFKAAMWGIACFIVLMCEFIIAISPIMSFNTGDYLTVEGYVEDFKPYRQGEMESFRINGIEFNYSHGIITSGYRKTYNRGGVIRENGQYLRISYVPMENRNEILCIQEPPFVEIPENEVSLFFQFYIITIPLTVFICYLFWGKYHNRKRIIIDKNKSFIRQVAYTDKLVIIRCVITFNNKFNKEKQIKILGYFKSLWKNNITTVYKADGTDELNNLNYLNIPVGISKMNISFELEKSREESIRGTDSLGLMLPKVKIKVLGKQG